MINIRLLSFDNGLADFELYNGDEVVTCHARIDLNCFYEGELFEILNWYDSEEIEIEKPDWVDSRIVSDVNDLFEVEHRKIMMSQVDDQCGVM